LSGKIEPKKFTAAIKHALQGKIPRPVPDVRVIAFAFRKATAFGKDHGLAETGRRMPYSQVASYYFVTTGNLRSLLFPTTN